MDKTEFIIGLVCIVALCLILMSWASEGIDPELDEAMTWALGPDWQKLDLSLVPDTWNERHGDIFLLKYDDPVVEGRQRMYGAWLRKDEVTYKQSETLSFKELNSED